MRPVPTFLGACLAVFLAMPSVGLAGAVDDVSLIQGANCAGLTGYTWRIRNNNKSQTVQVTLEKQGAPDEVVILQPAEEKGLFGCYYKVTAKGGKYL